jgi:hypothetical protein
MNDQWANYLEQEQKQELTETLTAEGYQIIEPKVDESFDLLARKGNEIIAYEIKLANRLGSFADQLEGQRRLASERGYKDFRLVVVKPPREIEVDVAGIELKLAAYLNEHMPPELVELAQHALIREVSDVSFNGVHVLEGTTHVSGDATASIDVEHEASNGRDGLTIHTMLPFTFDVVMDANLKILEARCIFDVTSWYD